MRNRQWRRSQRERIIARTEKWMKSNGWMGSHNPSDYKARIRRNAVTPHPCSGYCCGNPRKWFGHHTLQEQKASVIEEFFDELPDTVDRL